MQAPKLKKKRGYNLKGRIYRKSRKSKKCKNHQPLSKDKLILNYEALNQPKSRKQHFPKHKILDRIPRYMTNQFLQEYIKVISRKVSVKELEVTNCDKRVVRNGTTRKTSVSKRNFTGNSMLGKKKSEIKLIMVMVKEYGNESGTTKNCQSCGIEIKY